jgi:hypothetical protein
MVKIWTKSDHKYASYDVLIDFQDGVRRHLVFSFISFSMAFSNTASWYGAMLKIWTNRTINTVVMTYNWFSRWRIAAILYFRLSRFDGILNTARWYGAMVKFEQNRFINTVVMTYNWFSRWRSPPSCIFVYPVSIAFLNTASWYGAMVKTWTKSDHKYGSYDV